MSSRREFLERAGLAAAGFSLPLSPFRPLGQMADVAPTRAAGFADILRTPDAVMLQTMTGNITLDRAGSGTWSSKGSSVTASRAGDALRLSLAAPTYAVKRVHVRWRVPMTDAALILGDAWERGYGDLEWRAWAVDRVMPWYTATLNGRMTHAYGVRTGARAMCFWQVDPSGISLWADVRSGGVGIQLGDRGLDMCDVVSRPGKEGETSFAALHAFCRQMCPNPRLPLQPVYGSNDWYWAYGNNSADTVLLDTAHLVELSPTGANRPFSVIDDGWQPERSKDKKGVGTWDRGNEKFPDMPALAVNVKRGGARPGIWVRPLLATAETPDALRLARDRTYLDPSVPEVLQKVTEDIARLRQWGYELIKHDFTTYDLLGRWGFQMGAAITRDAWTYKGGPTRTTAEVIHDLYRTIRAAAGESLVIGCNTVSHLSAGQFEICRIGDDTSGTEWSRTRKYGVNTLAFRGVQHGAFYVADADCVGVTNALPWSLNRQWLDLLAKSGTMLFASLDPKALDLVQKRDLQAAFAVAAVPQPLGEPLDWQHNVYPSRWRLMGQEVTYDWVGADGPGMP